MQSSEPEKKSAFAVLRAASRRPTGSPTAQQNVSKKQRLSKPGESSFSPCPICGRVQPLALLESHVQTCSSGAEESAAAATPRAAYAAAGPSKQLEEEPAGGNHDVGEASPPEPATSVAAADDPTATRRPNDAFAKLMQHQRAHSSVHNFYLEAKIDGSWTWHWFVTPAHADARVLAKLAPGPAAKPGRNPETSKGAVDPRVRNVFGSQPVHAGPQLAPKPAETPAQMQGSFTGGNAGRSAAAKERHRIPAPDSKQASAAEPPGQKNDSWQKLPVAAWHSLTHLQASKLGGSPKMKLAIRLLTNAPPGDGGEVDWESGGFRSNDHHGASGTYKGSNSLLKSALQKNVRLCKPESAVRCALHLIKEDPSEFLRRCCIVCLEDAVLHPAFPLLVWLMAAHARGYALGRRQVGRCLALVHHIAQSPLKDHQPHQGPRAAKSGSSVDLFEGVHNLSGEAALLVRCILMRAGYGGMGGDVELLKSAAEIWAQRFAGAAAPPPSKDAGRAESWLQYIWTLAGQLQATIHDPNFHVSSIVDELLNDPELASQAQKHGGDLASRLRKCFWMFRSSLTSKVALGAAAEAAADPAAVDDDLQQLWAVAMPKAESWSATFLARRFY